MMDNFNNTFGVDISKQHGAMPPEYKPKLDTIELCTDTERG